MSSSFYRLDFDHVFEESIGSFGADRARFDYWLDRLSPMILPLRSMPQREAEPIFSLPETQDDLSEIESIASRIAAGFSTLVVVGMGGSSLSAETLACIRKTEHLALRFIDNIDPHSFVVFCENLDWKHSAFLIISKSGGTVETLAQTSVLLRHAKARLANYAEHFFIITITNDNVLHALAKSHDIRVLGHDPKLGGRFSILSSVGLIPAAAIGLDIRALRHGAKTVLDNHFTGNYANAPAAQGAALHMALREKQVRMQVFMHYCDRLGGLANWFRQCWGESLGKSDMATTPICSRMTTDQHSQLQLYLDGPKDKFFSLMLLDSRGQGEKIDFECSGDPRLKFLSGKRLGDLMVAEQRATLASLAQRGCPVRCFMLPDINEEVMGALLMHFELEIMFVARLMGVDAFDQPAVEDSKLFALTYLAGDDVSTGVMKKS